MTGSGRIRGDLAQRYALAAALCEGLRVLDLEEAPAGARDGLALVEEGSECEAVLALSGSGGGDDLIAALERHAAAGARVIAAFERAPGAARSPRAAPPAQEQAERLAERLPGAGVLPQFLAEGSLIGPPDGAAEARLELDHAGASGEDAAAFIVVSGFEEEALSRARAALRVTVTPVLSSYVQRLEAANAELLRANRMLMRERLGRDGSGGASLLEVKRQAAEARRERDEMEEVARGHEEQIHRVEAWYDAPRYHLVDRIRGALTRLPGFTATVRFLWSLVSTRAESPRLDAAANPGPEPDEDDLPDAAEVTREREGLEPGEQRSEPAETSSRLEQ